MFLWKLKSWQLHSDDEDNVSEVSEATEYIVSLFCIPFEARGMSAELIGDELEHLECYTCIPLIHSYRYISHCDTLIRHR